MPICNFCHLSNLAKNGLPSSNICNIGFMRDRLSKVTIVTWPFEEFYVLLTLMKPKAYIAVFLTLLFIVKVVSVDAKAYSMLLQSNEITLVNQYCDYGKFMGGSDEQQDFQEAQQHLILQIDFLCNTPVQLSVVEWESIVKEPVFKKHGYLPPSMPLVHTDRFYPPPRV